jgi:hypothetical protein
MAEPTPKNPNRIDPLAGPAQPNVPAEYREQTVSLLPSKFMPIAAAIVGIATGLMPVFAPGTLPFTICTVLIGIGAVFGIVSTGVQRK